MDTGKIVFEEKLRITKDTPMERLRIVNTEACISMSALAISTLIENSNLPSRIQSQAGRYYSFMPSTLKEICLLKYNHFLQKFR